MKKYKNIEIGYVFSTNGGCDAKVVDYRNCKNILVEFMDKHRHQTITSSTHIRSGSVKNPYQPSVAGVGYVGVGEYAASVGTESTPEYLLWKRMIYRCYDKAYHKRQPTYKDCTVCDEWHNFQNFAKWLSLQLYYKGGYELDKDLVVRGNKEYSPAACRFVPKKLNVILNNCEASRGTYPVGVCFNKNEGKFVSAIRIDGKRKYLGYFESANDAYQAYVKEKEFYVREAALKFKGQMDADVFDALISWNVGQ